MAEYFQFASPTLTKKTKSMFSRMLDDFNKLVCICHGLCREAFPGIDMNPTCSEEHAENAQLKLNQVPNLQTHV